MKRPLRDISILAMMWTLLSTAALGESLPTEEMTKKGETFLALLDQGELDAAWANTSPLFQAFNNRPDWELWQRALREAYGPVLTRSFLRTDYRDSYHESPDGDYVIVQFTTNFLHKQRAVETIVYDCNTDCRVRVYILP